MHLTATTACSSRRSAITCRKPSAYLAPVRIHSAWGLFWFQAIPPSVALRFATRLILRPPLLPSRTKSRPFASLATLGRSVVSASCHQSLLRCPLCASGRTHIAHTIRRVLVRSPNICVRSGAFRAVRATVPWIVRRVSPLQFSRGWELSTDEWPMKVTSMLASQTSVLRFNASAKVEALWTNELESFWG